MDCQPLARSLVAACLLFLLGPGMVLRCAASCQDEPPGGVSFERDILPVFEQHCLSCHGPDKEETFRIDDRRATLDGYVEKGDAESSRLYEVLVTDDPDELMPPPDEKNPLSAAQIARIREWIDAGAEWPQGVKFTPPAARQTPEAVVGDEVAGEEVQSPGALDQPPAKPAGKPARSLGERAWLAVGALHPAVVHIPIGLLLGAGLFALLGLRGNFVMGDCAYYCLWLGALGCIASSVVGWPYAITENRGGDVADLFNTEKAIFLHRITGLGVSVAALLLALYASAKRASDPDDGLLWKLGAILLAGAVGFVGHTGGDLTHGKNHYRPLREVIEEATGWDLGGSARSVPPPADPQAIPESADPVAAPGGTGP